MNTKRKQTHMQAELKILTLPRQHHAYFHTVLFVLMHLACRLHYLDVL